MAEIQELEQQRKDYDEGTKRLETDLTNTNKKKVDLEKRVSELEKNQHGFQIEENVLLEQKALLEKKLLELEKKKDENWYDLESLKFEIVEEEKNAERIKKSLTDRHKVQLGLEDSLKGIEDELAEEERERKKWDDQFAEKQKQRRLDYLKEEIDQLEEELALEDDPIMIEDLTKLLKKVKLDYENIESS